MLQCKLTDLTVKSIFPLIQSVKINWFSNEKYFLKDESIKNQISDSISENLTDSDLESIYTIKICIRTKLCSKQIKAFLFHED